MKKYMNRTIPLFKFDWCKLSNAESGCVSNNYLAYCRLVKWIYHPITTFEEDMYVEKSSSVETWNKDVCIKWLKRYGFNFDQGLKSLRSTIMMYKQSSIPLIEVNENSSSDSTNMMIGGMLSMLSQVMNRDVTDGTPSQMDRDIKLFLFYLNIVSIFLQTKNTVWIRSYNYQSLLNLPFAVTVFGPLANSWEGGNCGEEYLRHVKPRIHDAPNKNWNMNVHINLLNYNLMAPVLDTHFSNKL